jgi:hypothetical protein
MLPWFLYQHYYDPPGTKVAKIQLAGQRIVDPHQSLLQAVERRTRSSTPARSPTTSGPT